jgi:hypothetical protein
LGLVMVQGDRWVTAIVWALALDRQRAEFPVRWD